MAGWKLYLVVLPAFLLLDFLWLGVLMKHFYDAEIGDLARRSGGSLAPRWPVAILFYALFPAGIVAFVRPAMGDNAAVWQAAAWGAAFGLFTYGTYDLTNLAVLEKWSYRLTAVDLAWGCTICALSAAVMRGVERWFAA